MRKAKSGIQIKIDSTQGSKEKHATSTGNAYILMILIDVPDNKIRYFNSELPKNNSLNVLIQPNYTVRGMKYICTERIFDSRRDRSNTTNIFENNSDRSW